MDILLLSSSFCVWHLCAFVRWCRFSPFFPTTSSACPVSLIWFVIFVFSTLSTLITSPWSPPHKPDTLSWIKPQMGSIIKVKFSVDFIFIYSSRMCTYSCTMGWWRWRWRRGEAWKILIFFSFSPSIHPLVHEFLFFFSWSIPRAEQQLRVDSHRPGGNWSSFNFARFRWKFNYTSPTGSFLLHSSFTHKFVQQTRSPLFFKASAGILNIQSLRLVIKFYVQSLHSLVVVPVLLGWPVLFVDYID